MFICCENQLQLFEENSYNFVNISDIKFESVKCICNVCKKNVVCSCIWQKCYKSLDKGKFELCRNIYSLPISSTLNLDKNKIFLKKIFSKHKMYDNFYNDLLLYLIKYTNFYKIYSEVKMENDNNIVKTKKCFTPFFCFGILYSIKNKKKFICNDCIEK